MLIPYRGRGGGGGRDEAFTKIQSLGVTDAEKHQSPDMKRSLNWSKHEVEVREGVMSEGMKDELKGRRSEGDLGRRRRRRVG